MNRGIGIWLGQRPERGVNPSGAAIRLCTQGKEGRSLLHNIHSIPVHLAVIYRARGSWPKGSHVQHIRFVKLAAANVDQGEELAKQFLQLLIQLGRGMGRTKRRPVEQASVQIDGAGVRCLDHVSQLYCELKARVEPKCPLYRQGRQIEPTAPAATLVGMGRCGELDARAKGHRTKLLSPGQRASDHVAAVLSFDAGQAGHSKD